MAEGELLNSLITIGVLVGLGLLIYCKLMDKTLLDVFMEVREMFSTQTEEVEVAWT